jgi:hypothetical protein
MTSATITTPGAPAGPTTAARRRWVLLAGAAVLVIVVAGGLVLLLGSSQDKAPYADAASTGTITLCNAAGKPVTSGSTTQAPFAVRAVGATATKAGTQSGKAVLYAYQPRQGASAEEWSGQQLTAPAAYTDNAHPMAAGTTKDIALKSFLTAFPAQWKGFVQLRLYLSSTAGAQTQAYDTADLKISGGTWKLVGTAGKASCTDGSAVSDETKAGLAP